MEGLQFDRLTQSRSTRVSRRGALRGVGAMIAALGFGVANSAEARHHKKRCLPPGHAKCAGGCANLLTSVRNCGACGVGCAAGQTCLHGNCHVGLDIVRCSNVGYACDAESCCRGSGMCVDGRCA